MPNSLIKIIIDTYPTPEAFLELSEVEVERVLLRCVAAASIDPLRRTAQRDGIFNELIGLSGYQCDFRQREPIEKSILRAWKVLEDTGLIEEPDATNGRNGHRVISEKGKTADQRSDFAAAKIRSQVKREHFPFLPNASWNAFRAGDYDTAVFEAFKAIEAAVRKKASLSSSDFGASLMDKAFDPANGPLASTAAAPGRRNARRNLFKGAFGELRNPIAHGDPTITEPLLAIQEMMTASLLLRIVDEAP
jgi:uncharacterized protein (TIGR02391 family)